LGDCVMGRENAGLLLSPSSSFQENTHKKERPDRSLPEETKVETQWLLSTHKIAKVIQPPTTNTRRFCQEREKTIMQGISPSVEEEKVKEK
jgi:hypothetical protein